MDTREHAPLWVTFSGLMLVLLVAALDNTIVATALPTIVDDLGGLEHISWVTSAYLLAQTAVTPLYGKLGDLYGRKRILQVALLIFLAGSALCGLSQSMTELIAFRAVQGLGAGGLIVLTQAVIGDIVSPRERGRYQGIFGAVFGMASVAGPLLGGFLVEHASWHWIFYVNLPIGALAFVVIAATLPSAGSAGRPVIDYLGAGLLASGLSAIVLVTSLGGTTWDWASAETFLTGALGLAALVLFAFVERRAQEPVLPPSLWREPVFRVAGALSLIVGFALFGAVTFLPLYFQTVDADTPTESGLRLLPMIVGLLITSIASGQVISRIGRYKAFPIAGTAIMTVGMFLLSRLEVGTSTAVASVYLLVLGLGLGMTMQVLVLAVQNSVPYAVLGTATSGVTHAARDRRLARHRDLRLDLHEPARRHPGEPARAGAAGARRRRAADRRAGRAAPRRCPPRVPAGLRRRAHAGVPRRRRRHAGRVRAELAAAGASAAGDGRDEPGSRGQPRRAARAGLARRARARARARDHARGARAVPAPRRRPRRRRYQPGCDVGARADRRARLRRRSRDGRGAGRRPGPHRRGRRGAARGALLAGEEGAPELTPAGRAVTDQVVAARRELLAETVADEGAHRRPEVDALLRRLARELVGERP